MVSFQSGDVVSTAYGPGRVVNYRSEDEIYQVQLISGGPITTGSCTPDDAATTGTTGTNTAPTSVADVTATTSAGNSSSTALPVMLLYCPLSQLSRGAVAMELDVAYQALEVMRKLNLEMECQENSIPFSPSDLEHHCTVCLLSRTPLVVSHTTLTSTGQPTTATRKHPPRKPPATKKSNPCLCCGRPVCSVHASAVFKKERVHMCGACESLFGTDYVVTLCTEPNARQRRHLLDRLMDVYDRSVLVLRYAATSSSSSSSNTSINGTTTKNNNNNTTTNTNTNTTIDTLCTALQSATVRQNRVGLGSSSAGIVSGVLGIVSCATLLTPVGPPLVIASLVFGGSAAAAQTGAEMRHTYFFAPNQHADRLIALHGLCWNILHIVALIRDTVVQFDSFQTTHINSSHIISGSPTTTTTTANSSGTISPSGAKEDSSSPTAVTSLPESPTVPPEHSLPETTGTGTKRSFTNPSRTNSNESTNSTDKNSSFFSSPRRATSGSSGSYQSPSRRYSADSTSTTSVGGGPTSVTVGGSLIVQRRSSNAALEHQKASKSSAANRGARFLSRSTTAALNSMQFARVGGGALSAATLVWETHNLRNTLQKMKAGNPCAKAETLRRIRDEILYDLPTTASLADECDLTLELLSARSTVLSVDEVRKLLEDNEAAISQEQDHSASSNDSSLTSTIEVGGATLGDGGVTESDATSNPTIKSREIEAVAPRRMTLRERLWRKRPKDTTTASYNSSITSLGYEEEGNNETSHTDKATDVTNDNHPKERICDATPSVDPTQDAGVCEAQPQSRQ